MLAVIIVVGVQHGADGRIYSWSEGWVYEISHSILVNSQPIPFEEKGGL